MHPDDFAFDLRRSLTPPNHLFVNSGHTTVAPLPDVAVGVGELFSPPFAGRGLAARAVFTANGHRVVDDGNTGKGDCGLLYSGGRWYPHRIVRTGTYHRMVDGRLLSFHVQSTLTPLSDAAGYVMAIEVRNRASERLELAMAVELDPGAPSIHPLDAWIYSPPGHSVHGPAKPLPARFPGERRWANSQANVELIQPVPALSLSPGATGTLWFAVVGNADTATALPEGGLPEWADRTRTAWERRMAAAAQRLPAFDSDIPGVKEYARRGLLSGFVACWDKPDFLLRPHLATSGMDGGAMCSYLWDVGGYAPRAVAQWLGPHAAVLARAMADIGLDRFYALAPGGGGVGCAYAYSAWSYLQLVWATALFEGPDPHLFAHARDSFLGMEAKAKKVGGLVDFGDQHNLLEMRASGWEGVTASPNAERAENYELLARLADALGQPGGAAWREQAAGIRAEIRRVLWNPQAGWFDALHADGRRETVYSIQAFDAWRSGACDPGMAEALAAHVRDGAFLGDFGVSSVSAEDELHYELNDPDWSGGGAYTGDGPVLALTLWEQNRPREAWEVLRRLLWMGRSLVYYPQEHYCDRPAVPAHKRSNIVSGLAAWEACVYGLSGLTPGLDGGLTLAARSALPGGYRIGGFRFRGREIAVESDGQHRTARVDGKVVSETPVWEADVVVPPTGPAQ